MEAQREIDDCDRTIKGHSSPGGTVRELWYKPDAFLSLEALDRWVNNYNEDYPHSSLNYKTPCGYERNYAGKFT